MLASILQVQSESGSLLWPPRRHRSPIEGAAGNPRETLLEYDAVHYGPVARAVYDEFKHCGRAIIEEPSGPVAGDPFAIRMVDEVAATYGKMSAFDLVKLSHRDGGAWRKVYVPAGDNPITVEDIRASRDMDGFPGLVGTVRGTIAAVADSIPNALNLLRSS